MQQREKYLAIGLGSIVVLWFGLPVFESTFLQPINNLVSEEEALQVEANERFDQQIEQRKRAKQLADWRKISLPPDPLDAQRLYEEWVSSLAKLSGFEGTKVTLGRRSSQQDVFVTIPVTLETKATAQELAQFLERFESVELLHRISTCDVISPASEGNPDLQITLTAEGLSMKSAKQRTRLFPQIRLQTELKENQTVVEIEDATGFPEKANFRVRIDDEFLNVTAIDGNKWTLQRGVASTFSKTHQPGTTLELFPLLSEIEADSNAVEAMWSQSIFTKPAPQADYDPKLAATTAPPAIRGTKWNWKLNVTSWNPAFGSPMYTLIDSPQGVEIDERTGNLSWNVASEIELGPRELQVLVYGSASKQAGFTSTVDMRVRDPNEPPVIDQASALRFFLGRASKKTIAADDPDGENTKLKFSIANAPEGMQIGEDDGVLSWTPAESLEAQTYEIQVTVTDSDEDPESVTKTIPVSLEEDSARYTFLTTTFKRVFGEGREEWEAYLFDRATNKTTMLKKGEEVTITDFEMTVKGIGDDFVEVARPDGMYRIVFERPLVEMVKLPDSAIEAAAIQVPKEGAEPTELANETKAAPPAAPVKESSAESDTKEPASPVTPQEDKVENSETPEAESTPEPKTPLEASEPPSAENGES